MTFVYFRMAIIGYILTQGHVLVSIKLILESDFRALQIIKLVRQVSPLHQDIRLVVHQGCLRHILAGGLVIHRFIRAGGTLAVVRVRPVPQALLLLLQNLVGLKNMRVPDAVQPLVQPLFLLLPIFLPLFDRKVGADAL